MGWDGMGRSSEPEGPRKVVCFVEFHIQRLPNLHEQNDEDLKSGHRAWLCKYRSISQQERGLEKAIPPTSLYPFQMNSIFQLESSDHSLDGHSRLIRQHQIGQFVAFEKTR